jgi:WD40 repeat protein
MVNFHPLGHSICAGTSQGYVLIWDMITKTIIRELKEHKEGITSLEWFENTKYLCSGSKDGKIVVWDVVTAQAFKYFTIRDTAVIFASFLPNQMYGPILSLK